MKKSEIIILAQALVGTDMLKRWEAARQLDHLLAGRKNLSAAVPILSGYILQIDAKVQPTVLEILAGNADRGTFVEIVGVVTDALEAKDRDERRKAAAILLAWTNREGIAPQQVYLALVGALRHEDNVLRKHVADRFWNRASQAPDFSAIVPILLAAYNRDEEINRRIDHALESAAKRNLDIRAALPALTKRLRSPRPTSVLTALIAHQVH